MFDWQTTWQAITQYLPANPFGTFVSAAFGTIGGAWVASRVQTKRAVVAELNSVSSALALCFTICNKAMSLKRQHVLPVRERYDQARRDFDKARIANANREGGPPIVYTLHADLETLTFPKMPTELLERQLFEKIARGRALAAAVDLVGVIDGLEQAIEQRNDLINEFRAAAPIPPDILIHKYFGITNPQGVTDARVRTNIRAIEMQTDDCIFFSRVLADDLVEYARKLRRKHIWKLRMFLPDISTADWSEAERTGLFPPDEQYKDWLKGFSKRGPRASSAYVVGHGCALNDGRSS